MKLVSTLIDTAKSRHEDTDLISFLTNLLWKSSHLGCDFVLGKEWVYLLRDVEYFQIFHAVWDDFFETYKNIEKYLHIQQIALDWPTWSPLDNHE